MTRFYTAAVAVCLGTTPQLAADENKDFDLKTWTTNEALERYRTDLLAAHQLCNVEASRRALTTDKAQTCSENFLELKLSFLPGASRERYHRLSPSTRKLANEKGYAAYRAWLYRHRSLD
ncbi:hypothetical protein PGB28_12990 [Primorskyibacter aestuariivivens]|uniref:hypothetical protein n=1 Tax=Primorskyibacter aestuariivivens TaxID=1888912 RepID=UPI0023002C73|nr:hypothetical protein [Primorskyibacter aestuariivivens]MDA7429381.1 hypothetical protein [Primorskyibacter aestuariivivens]